MINLLIDKPPETVVLGGKEFLINFDFRYSIMFELLMQDGEVPKEDKIINALDIYFGGSDISEIDISEAVEFITYFYSCGKVEEGCGKKPDSEVKKNRRIYDFEQDDEYIYSAFLSCYEIDLVDVKELHWWKFRALFKSLGDDCMFSKIMSYRAIEIDNQMSKEERKFYKRMKQIYALPDPRTEDEKSSDFASALGGF